MVKYNKGAYPTMITPYKEDGTVDYDAVKKYVYWYHENGCDGIFAVCQSSEIFYLSPEERVKINKTVYDTVKEIEKKTGKRMTVVSSGHVSDTIEEQARELNAIYETGTDALILITNRLDLNNEGDDVWIENAQRLLDMLPKDVALGVYECPYPYKRLLTPRILQWCLEKGRFKFIKDTCCNVKTIKERIKQLDGSDFLLFNANCQTLLSTLKYGCAGYCGIMCNFHPRLYVWLCKNFKKHPETAELIQSFTGTAGFTEPMAYPLTAKYNMCLEGIKTANIARNRESGELTDYAMDCVEQMRLLSKYFEKLLEEKDENTNNFAL